MIEVSFENIEEDNSYEYIIDRVVKEVLKEEGIVHDVSVYVRLTDNEGIHAINKEHRGVDSPTDVLSFPMYEKEEIAKLRIPKEDDVEETLGDIIVSIPKVKEQAEEYGHSVERELAYLVCHGMHHLLGYDHIEEEDKKVMREHEEKVLTALQIFRVEEGEALSTVDREVKTDSSQVVEEVTEVKEEKTEEPIEDKAEVVVETTEDDKEEKVAAVVTPTAVSIASDNVNAKLDSIINENIEQSIKEVPKAREYVVEPKIKETKSDHTTLISIIAFLIVLGLALWAVYAFVIKPIESPVEPENGYSGEQVENASGDEEESGEIIEEEVYLGPKVFSGDSRSIAFMIDNDVKASLPHAGLNNAYMVYEIIVEGGASRLMAVFKYDNLPDKIGPIRSCRHYFLDYVQEHDALYCHIGQSTQGGEALRDRGIQHIETDHARIGPDRTWHNAFAVKEKVYKAIENKGWRTTQKQDCIIKYNEKDTDLDSKEYADVITCKFPVSTTVFKYDEDSKTYLIDMKGEPHVDKFNGEQSYAKNLLVYQINNQSVWDAWGDHREADNKKRQEIYNTGTGKGYYITNGKAIEMCWSKATHSSKTKYTDIYGNELKFNDGITWVEIIPSNGSFKITSNHIESSSGELNSGD